MIKQLIMIRRKYQKYTSFGLATVQDVFTKAEMKDAMVLQATNLNSSIVYNLGNDEFGLELLPRVAQIAPLYGMITADINHDTYPDLILSGNDFGLELTQGRADAMQGLVLLNDQKGGFLPINYAESGFFVQGDAKSMLNIKSQVIGQLIVNMINLDSLVLHHYKVSGISVKPEKNEYQGIISFKNGSHQKVEFYPGNSFKSQSNSDILLLPEMKEIQLENALTKSVRTIRN
jgi:hypothetical protein